MDINSSDGNPQSRNCGVDKFAPWKMVGWETIFFSFSGKRLTFSRATCYFHFVFFSLPTWCAVKLPETWFRTISFSQTTRKSQDCIKDCSSKMQLVLPGLNNTNLGKKTVNQLGEWSWTIQISQPKNGWGGWNRLKQLKLWEKHFQLGTFSKHKRINTTMSGVNYVNITSDSTDRLVEHTCNWPESWTTESLGGCNHS